MDSCVTGGTSHTTLLKDAAGIETFLDEAATDGPVIIKHVSLDDLGTTARMRLEHEVDVLRGVGGAGAVIGCTIDDGQLWLTRGFVTGIPLQECLRLAPLATDDVVTVAIAVLRQLAEAHALGIVHRDVKPANVVTQGGNPVTGAILIDFGLARSPWLDPAMRDQAIASARYMSPEQAGSIDSPVDERSDLYSLGVVLYECLTGHPPFDGSSVGELLRHHVSSPVPDVRDHGVAAPRALSELVNRLMRKDPGDRYQSAVATLADLEAIDAARRSGVPDPLLTIGQHDRRATLTEPSFVGRQDELSLLVARVSELRDGNGGLVVVAGESGGGKTRLLDEAARQASLLNAWVLRGQAVDQAGQRPFQLLDGVAAAIAEAAESDPTLLSHLRTTLGEETDAVVATLPRLATLLEVDHGLPLPEEFGEARSLHALAALLDALGTAHRPAVVLLDDCQWAESLSARMLASWARHPRTAGGRHVMVVAAYRSEEVGPTHPLRALPAQAELLLRPIGEAEVRALVRSMAGDIPPQALAAVTRLGEGSPFMTQAVLRGMVECGALVPGVSGWEVDPRALAMVRTSSRAAAFLTRRLELLSEPALRLLTIAAVLGKDFDLEVAIRLCGLAAHEAVPAVDEARTRRILWLDETRGRGVFLHDKLREAVLERLDPTDRAELHGRAARMLQSSGAATDFDLAYHFDAARRAHKALPYAIAAAEQARAQHALETAETYYGIANRAAEGSDAATRVRVSEGLADVLTLRGRYAEAESSLVSALALTRDHLRRAALEGKLGSLAFRRGDQSEACLKLEGALRSSGQWVPRRHLAYLLGLMWELAIQVGHTLLPHSTFIRRRSPTEAERLAMHLHSRLAYAYWFRSGRVPCAWTHLRGLNLAERFPPSAELAQAYSEHAPVVTMIPWYTRGFAYAGRSRAIRAQLGDVWGEGQSLSFYGIVLYAAGRYRECIEACEEAVRILARTGDQWEINTATWHLAFAHYRLGELRQAAAISTHLHRVALEIGDHSSAGIALSSWARATGGHLPAEATAAALARPDDDVHAATEVRLAEGVRLLADGQPALASQVLRSAWAAVKRAGLRQEYVAPVLPWLATALRHQLELLPDDDPARQGLTRERRKVARAARRLARSYRNNMPHALRELAMADAAAGRSRRAAHHLARSIELAESQGAEHELAQSLLLRGKLGQFLGWPRVAEDLAQAASLLARCGDGGPAETRPDDDAPTLSLIDRFETLMEVGRAIAAAVTPGAVYSEIRQAAVVLLRAEVGHVVEVGGLGAAVATTTGERLDPISDGLLRQAVAEQRVITWSDPDGVGPRSVLCAPITCDGQAVACFCVTHSEIVGLFRAEEEQLANFIATLAGASLDHAADSQAHFRALVQNAYDVTAVVDATGRPSFVSPASARILGYSPDEILGTAFAFVDPADAACMRDAIALVLRDPAARPTTEVRATHRDGSALQLQFGYTNLLHVPSISGIVINIHDVTERHRADQAVAMATAQFQVAFENAPIGMALTALQTEMQGHYIRVNQALADMLGYSRGDLEGVDIRDLTHPDDWAADDAGIRLLQSRQATTFEVEKRYRHADGRWVWIHLKAALVLDPLGRADYTISQMVDITEWRAAEEQLTYQARHDPLTGLPNRRFLLERLDEAIAQSQRSGTTVAVLYLDLDRFKVFNDSFGHETGDQILIEVASRLARLLRENDTLARLGGDEFVMLVEDLDDEGAVDGIAKRIQEALHDPLVLPEGMTVSVTTSVGIAVCHSGQDRTSLLRDADTALYQAKAQGTSRHAIFNQQLRHRAVGRMKAERDLRRAMADDRMVLQYQPVLDFETGQVVGAEALIRYLDHHGGLVPPVQFVGVAEETGIINSLGAWVVREGCEQLARWGEPRDLGDFRLNVNVSPRQLTAGDFTEVVSEILDDTRVIPGSLSLELTEGALMTMDATRPTLDRLRQIGCRVGIDDFGTGYSCLAYLRQLPIDFLKIDRSFVMGLGSGNEDTAIIRAMLNLAEGLGLAAVAEGVETAAQKHILGELGCRLGQGYLFGRPMGAKAFEDLFLAPR